MFAVLTFPIDIWSALSKGTESEDQMLTIWLLYFGNWMRLFCRVIVVFNSSTGDFSPDFIIYLFFSFALPVTFAKFLAHQTNNFLLPEIFYWYLQVETYNTERALRKIKRHPTSITLDGSVNLKEKLNEPSGHNVVNELSRKHLEKPRLASEENASPGNNGEGESKSSNFGRSSRRDGATSNFVGGAASW